MTLSVLIFVFLALLVIGLLLWASRPPQSRPTPPQDIFEGLSHSRHCLRLHPILQALQPEDTEYLVKAGHSALSRTLPQDRRRVALLYLNCLQEEFESLLDISRALSVMSPEVIAQQEVERWKLSIVFWWRCVCLRWRLRLRMQPLAEFATLSNMATEITRQLEKATSKIAEAAITGTGLPIERDASAELP